jgi:hypothetical protein
VWWSACEIKIVCMRMYFYGHFRWFLYAAILT